ncbi:MAG: hypothetical protein QG668_554 [Patescibacteria group bacterium]|jgi:hypothetical protein|nr:hypothetical protein [Patescibacteria group bacterium]
MIYFLTLVRHTMMAAWVLALGAVGFETVFPGSVSIRAPLYPLVIGLVLLTILIARFVIPPTRSRMRWVSAMLFAVATVGVLAVLGLAQWGTTTLVGTVLAVGLVSAWVAGWAFIAHDDPESV